MKSTDTHLVAFAHALERYQPIFVSEKGEWHLECRLVNLFRRQTALIASLTESRLLATRACRRVIGDTENGLQDISKKKQIIDVCHRIANAINHTHLKRIVIAEGYREGVFEHKPIDEKIHLVLKELLKTWKQQQDVFYRDEKQLNARDLGVLNAVCKYEEFAKLLLEDQQLMSRFFNWSIRDNNQVRVFVEFPKTCQRIIEARISGHLGLFSGQILKVKKNDVTLRFEQEKPDGTVFIKSVSVLDESKNVTFKGGVVETIGGIFAIFARRLYGVQNFEMFGGKKPCIRNWNKHKLAYFDVKLNDFVSVIIDESNWWDKLPVFEVISQEALENRIGQKLTGEEWGVGIAQATRTNMGFDISYCHAFLSIAIKQNDGRYRIFDFGKYIDDFPQTFWDFLKLMANTVPSSIAYPDPNRFYSERQRVSVPYTLTKEEGLQLMSLILRDIQKARSNELSFSHCMMGALVGRRSFYRPF